MSLFFGFFGMVWVAYIVWVFSHEYRSSDKKSLQYWLYHRSFGEQKPEVNFEYRFDMSVIPLAVIHTALFVTAWVCARAVKVFGMLFVGRVLDIRETCVASSLLGLDQETDDARTQQEDPSRAKMFFSILTFLGDVRMRFRSDQRVGARACLVTLALSALWCAYVVNNEGGATACALIAGGAVFVWGASEVRWRKEGQ